MEDIDYPASKRQRVMRPAFAQEWINSRLAVALPSKVPVLSTPSRTKIPLETDKSKDASLPHWLSEEHLHRHSSSKSHKHKGHVHHHAALVSSSSSIPKVLERRQEFNATMDLSSDVYFSNYRFPGVLLIRPSSPPLPSYPPQSH